MHAARQAHEDFDEVVETDIKISQPMQQAMLDSEQGAEVAYWLGKNPKEAERIAQLPPVGAIREIGRIEASFATKKNNPAPKPKPLSKAPAPVIPISGGTAGGGSSIHDPDTAADFNRWEKIRRAQLKQAA